MEALTADQFTTTVHHLISQTTATTTSTVFHLPVTRYSFQQHFTSSVDPVSAKKTVRLSVYFAILGSICMHKRFQYQHYKQLFVKKWIAQLVSTNSFNFSAVRYWRKSWSLNVSKFDYQVLLCVKGRSESYKHMSEKAVNNGTKVIINFLSNVSGAEASGPRFFYTLFPFALLLILMSF